MKGTTINLSLPRALLNRVDLEAERETRTRSELIREVLRGYLERRLRWDDLFSFARQHYKGKGIKPSDVEAAIREVRGR